MSAPQLPDPAPRADWPVRCLLPADGSQLAACDLVRLAALTEDNAFLLKGDVFTQDVIDKWIEYKHEKEVNEMRLRPVPL